jgi:hypothetical protein
MWADSQRGRFDEHLFAYTLVKSCLLSGVGISNYRFPMPPTPIDYIVRAVAWLAGKHDNGTFHLSSSRQMLDNVFEHCAEMVGVPFKFLPYYEWIGEIKKLHYEGESLPIVPLVQFGFSLDEEAFNERQRNYRTPANIRFDLTRSHRELEAAGIEAPAFDEELLRVCLQSMCARDPDLAQWNATEDMHQWPRTGTGAGGRAGQER